MMKKLVIFLVAIALLTNAFAQTPQKMSYQAVIRNSGNVLITNKKVGMIISILENRTPVYVEMHTATTNSNGLVSLHIGEGVILSGSFAAIDWSKGSHYIKTETDPTGGTDYSVVGESELLSVPYALYAGSSSSTAGTPGPVGPAGPAGPMGPMGPAGSMGVAGKNALSKLMSGDATMDTLGVVTVSKDAITSIKIKDGSIKDIDLDKFNISLSGFGLPTSSISMDGNKITNLATPTNTKDAATKEYVDGAIAGASSSASILSLDAAQNLSIKGGNAVSLADLYQSLSLAGTVLSISGPRDSHVDLSGILAGLGTGSGGSGVIIHDASLTGSGSVSSPLTVSSQGINPLKLTGVFTNGNAGQVLSSNGSGGFNWIDAASGGGTTGLTGITAFGGLTATVSAPTATIGIIDGDISLKKINPISGMTILGNNTIDYGFPIAMPISGIKTMLALTKSDVGLGNVKDVDQTNANNLTTGTLVTGRFAPATIPVGAIIGDGLATSFLRGNGTWGPATGGSSVASAISTTAIPGVSGTNVQATLEGLKTLIETKTTAATSTDGPATHTKITYNANGLVTAGADATTSDIADSPNKRYVTDAQLTTLGSISGINTGNQIASTVPVNSFTGVTGPTVQDALQQLQSNISAAAGGGITAVNIDNKTLTGNGNSSPLGIAASGVTTSYIADENVTLTKIQKIPANSLIGNSSLTSKATPEAITIGPGLSLSGNTLSANGGTPGAAGGDITLVNTGGANYLSLTGQTLTANPIDLSTAAPLVHNHALDGLSDVAITSKLAGNVLQWNGSNWVNTALATSNQTINFTPDPSSEVTGSATGTTTLAPVLKIADGAVTNLKIASGIDGTKITGTLPNVTGINGVTISSTPAFKLSDGTNNLTISGAASSVSGTNSGDQDAAQVKLNPLTIPGITGSTVQAALTDVGGKLTQNTTDIAKKLDANSTITASSGYSIVKYDTKGLVTDGKLPTLEDLSNVSTASKSTGNVLQWDGTNSKWVSNLVSGINVPSINGVGIAPSGTGFAITGGTTPAILTIGGDGKISSGTTSVSGTNTGDQDASKVNLNPTPITGITGTTVQAALTDIGSKLPQKLDCNSAITASTSYSMVNYDAKGLVTNGKVPTTDDISDAASTTSKYVTPAQLTVLSNTSGTNTGDQTLSVSSGKLNLSGSTISSVPVVTSLTAVSGLSGTGTTGDITLSLATNAVEATNLKGNGVALASGTAGDVLQSNGDGTFSWKDLTSGVSVNASSLTLPTGYLFVGNASNQATAQAQNSLSLGGFNNTMGSKTIQNLADPTNAQDAVTKNYVDTKSILLSQKGALSGVAPLNASGTIDTQYLPSALVGAVTYMGTFVPGTTTLPTASSSKGYYYVSTSGGMYNSESYITGDWVISDGTSWSRVANHNTVTSVLGKTGAVTFKTDDVTEGITNLYYKDSRVDANATVVALGTNKEDKANKSPYGTLDTNNDDTHYPSVKAIKSYVDAKVPSTTSAAVNSVLTVSVAGGVPTWQVVTGGGVVKTVVFDNSAGNGVTGTVDDVTDPTIPKLKLTLGDLKATSLTTTGTINGSTIGSGATISAGATVSGSNTGDQNISFSPDPSGDVTSPAIVSSKTSLAPILKIKDGVLTPAKLNIASGTPTAGSALTYSSATGFAWSTPSAYTLPTAGTGSSGTLGGIKVGSGLTIDGSTSVLSTINNGTVTLVNISGSSGINVTNNALLTTIPTFSLSLGDITPTSVTATGVITGSNIGTSTVIGKNVTIADGTTISGSNAGDQIITLSGDLGGTSSGAPATTLNATIQSNAVTSAKILDGTITNADIASQTIIPTNLKGITTSGSSQQVLTSNGAGGFAWGSGSATNLNFSYDATNGYINSSTGTKATIPIGSTTEPGLMLATDKVKLDGAITSVTATDGLSETTTAGVVSLGINTAGIALGKLATIGASTLLGNSSTTAASPAEIPAASIPSMIGLGNVENTKLSTWAGSTYIKTLGTITAGTWNGTIIDIAHGGTGNSTGNAATATTATTATKSAITDDTSNITVYPTWVSATTGSQGLNTSSSKLTLNPSTGTLTAKFFSGDGSLLTNLNATNLTSGTILPARYGTGTIPIAALNYPGGANASSFLAGDGTWKAAGGSGVTNLTYTQASSTVNSSTGTGTIIPEATTSYAGLLNNTDKTKLTNIPTISGGATASGQVLTYDGSVANWALPGLQYSGTTGAGKVSVINGSTTQTANIPVATSTISGLMIPTDKAKLDSYPASTTTSGKVLTTNTNGIATWETPSGGSGGGSSSYSFGVDGASAQTTELLYKGSGSDKPIYTKGIIDGFFTMQIQIPSNTTVDYIKIVETNSSEISSISSNYEVLCLSITDGSGKWNKDVATMLLPHIAIVALRGNILNPTQISDYKYNTAGSNISVTKCENGELRIMIQGYPEIIDTTAGFAVILTF